MVLKFIDYLYSKSQLKREHESVISLLRNDVRHLHAELDELTVQHSELKVKNYHLQMFIEKHVPEEEKNKFFKV